MISLTVSYRTQQQTFTIQPYETISDLMSGVRQVFQLIPKIRLLDTNRLYVLDDVNLAFGRIYQPEEQANLKVVGLQDDTAGYRPPELLENDEVEPEDNETAASEIQQSEAQTPVIPEEMIDAYEGRKSSEDVLAEEPMRQFEMSDVFLTSVVPYVSRGLVEKSDFGRCVENPQKVVDELIGERPDVRGLIQPSLPLFEFPQRPQFQSQFSNTSVLKLNLLPIHSKLEQLELLEDFDLRQLRPDANEVSISQQVIKKLQDFKPYHPRIPYVPHVLIPKISSSIPLILSIERSAQFSQFERTFQISPYFSADETACFLFQNIPGVTQDQFCLKAYDDDYYFLGMRQLIEYDYIREQIREQKPLIFTITPLQEKYLQMPEFILDERRIRNVYQTRPSQEWVRKSEYARLLELFKDRNFKQFCWQRCSQHVSGKQTYLKEEALQTKTAVVAQEIQDPSRSYPVLLQQKISVEKATEFLEILVGRIYVPLSSCKQIFEPNPDFEPDITAYTESHFLFQTELADFHWRRTLEKTYGISRYFKQQIQSQKIQKNQLQSVNACLQYYKYLFRRCAIQVSAYLTYGSRSLSKCLFTQFLPAGVLGVRGKGSLGLSVDVHQGIHLPIRYQNIPPGTKVALTVWLVCVDSLVSNYGQKEDLQVFEKLFDAESDINCVVMEQLSEKLVSNLQRITIDPKQGNGKFYTQLGYKPLGAVLHDLYDVNQVLRGGKSTLKLWPEISSFWLSSLSILGSNESADPVEMQVDIRIPSIFQKQLFDQEAVKSIQERVKQANILIDQKRQQQQLNTVRSLIYRTEETGISEDPEVKNLLLRFSNKSCANMTDEDYQVLFKAKEQLAVHPQLLPVVLHAVPLHDHVIYDAFIKELQELYLKKLPIEIAMELLDFEYADAVVRNLAVWQLEQLNSYDLKTFTLQLVQSLKFERSTELFKFLLTQAVNNFKDFGYQFYWAMRSELRHSIANQELYKLMLLKILQNISEQDRKDLMLSEFVLNKLAHIARSVSLSRTLKQYGVPADWRGQIQQIMLENMLKGLNQDVQRIAKEYGCGYFKLPFSYTQLLDSFIVKKSKIMDSKKAPLMLFIHKFGLGDRETYVNGLVSSSYITMFKTGDDLRQDALVVQMLGVMNNIWLSNSWNPRMKLYRVIPTGPLEGMIEIVPNSATLAKITSESGGAIQAFSKRPITAWLYKTLGIEQFINQIKSGILQEDQEFIQLKERYTAAVQNFSSSCAAFNVATFLLGIGDRHNDNVMMTREGHFFHIDFGHFMGNFKKKLGIKREKAPFFFTPDMKQVLVEYDALLGKTQTEAFEQESCREFNLIRRQGTLFIVMVKMLVATGIEELTTMDDIQWLQKNLLPRLTNEEAAQQFLQKIDEAVATVTTRINNFAHLIAHK